MVVAKEAAKPMRETLPQRECLHCYKLFMPDRPKTKFCGNSCRVQNFWKGRSERSESNELARTREINDLRERIKELEEQPSKKLIVKKTRKQTPPAS
jgi:hypothetical protein